MKTTISADLSFEEITALALYRANRLQKSLADLGNNSEYWLTESKSSMQIALHNLRADMEELKAYFNKLERLADQ